MRFAVLGPVQVGDDGDSSEMRAVGGLMPRTVLAVLLLDAGRVVSADRLVDLVWADRPPATAGAALHNHMLRLRRMLGDGGSERIRAVAPGYVLRVEPGELDLEVFAARCEAGRQAMGQGRWAHAREEFAGALALWRGQPLEDVPSLEAHPRVGQLLEAQAQALEARIEADLHLGLHREVIGELCAMTAEHPLREGLHAQLMLALYRAGRAAEALEAFQALRHILVENLGVEPSNPLQQLQRRILNADPDLAGPPAASTGASAGTPPPVVGHYQLPADTRAFTGRARELGRLLTLAQEDSGGTHPATMVITAIDGMAGVGKTALAVRAAHLLADRFPDGQLFLDLYDYTQGMAPRDPGDALAALLTSLGAAPGQIPADLDARAAAYRERLAGTRTLIVLDNAATEAQVRPLIPGRGGCLVVIASRKRLKALDDAHTVALDVLPEPDALALLRELVGPTRALAGDPGWAQIAALCGYLPLALRIAAALFRHRPAWTLGHLADKLRAAAPGLGSFTDGERDLSAVFDLSYQTLADDQRTLLRRLGLATGPDTDVYAAAALLDVDPAQADQLLQDLVDHHLLAEPAAGRYRMHDLIRAYAHTLAMALDPEPERDRALEGLLHYYAHTAQSASQAITRFPRPEPGGPVPAHVPDLRDPNAARAWLRTEYPNLDAAAAYAHTHHLDSHALALAAGLAEILYTDGPWSRALDLHQATAETAELLGQPAARAAALTDLGRVRCLTGDYSQAEAALTQALEVYRAIGHRLGEANALTELGRVQYLTGDYLGAEGTHKRAVDIYCAISHRHGEANALTELGRVRELTADYPGAGDAFTRALEIYCAIGNRLGEAIALNNLGHMRDLTGDYPGAENAFTRALEIHRAIGNRLGEANVLNNLGRMRQQIGDYPGAENALTRAQEIYRAIGHRLGEAASLVDLGLVLELTGDYPRAEEVLARSLEIYRAIGHRSGEAGAMTALGRVWYLTGDYPVAEDVLARALEIFRAAGERGNVAWASSHYAAAVAANGDHTRALALYQQALAMNRELNHRGDEAVALEGIGEHYLATGDTSQGTAHLRQALEMYQRLGKSADVQRIQGRLADLASR